MLVFIDESWQKPNGIDVGALGAVAIPAVAYNDFCSKVYRIKQELLGANELSDCELKGNVNFAKSAFRKRDGRAGRSRLLDAVDQTFNALRRYHAKAFAVWTTHEEWLRLRNPVTTDLSQPYQDLLCDLRRFMRASGRDRRAMLFFDQRGGAEDLATACAVQNFVTRTNTEWRQRFVQVPHFTRSPVSPGLQAADLIAYLAAQQGAGSQARPELAPYWEQVRLLAYEHVTTKSARLALRPVSMPLAMAHR